MIPPFFFFNLGAFSLIIENNFKKRCCILDFKDQEKQRLVGAQRAKRWIYLNADEQHSTSLRMNGHQEEEKSPTAASVYSDVAE